MDDGHTRSGTDIGIIKLPQRKLENWDFTSIPFNKILSYNDILPHLKLQHPVFEKNITLTDLQGLWVNEQHPLPKKTIMVKGNNILEISESGNEIEIDQMKETNEQFIFNNGYILNKNSNSLIWKKRQIF